LLTEFGQAESDLIPVFTLAPLARKIRPVFAAFDIGCARPKIGLEFIWRRQWTPAEAKEEIDRKIRKFRLGKFRDQPAGEN
jgi:hypothetical protein